jgi:hypothetical protein
MSPDPPRSSWRTPSGDCAHGAGRPRIAPRGDRGVGATAERADARTWDGRAGLRRRLARAALMGLAGGLTGLGVGAAISQFAPATEPEPAVRTLPVHRGAGMFDALPVAALAARPGRDPEGR